MFQEMSTGGHNDLQRATEVARAMVMQYGMSDTLGPVALDRRSRPPFLAVPGIETNAEPLAEETSREIDAEVKRLMTEAHETAVGVLRDHRPALDAVMRRLLDREVVEGSEVRSLVTSAAVTGLRAA
jgi:cell division protease FtsH